MAGPRDQATAGTMKGLVSSMTLLSVDKLLPIEGYARRELWGAVLRMMRCGKIARTVAHLICVLVVTAAFMVGPAMSQAAALNSPSNTNAIAYSDSRIDVYWQDNSAKETGFEVDRYSDWSTPVSLGETVNSAAREAGSFISKDGLSLYFNSDRPGGFGDLDIYVSQRASVDDPWGPPRNLGPTINSDSADQTPTVSLDGHRLYFASSRPGGFGALDIYVSRRPDTRDDFGWGPPVNLGAGVNGPLPELGPAPFEDDATGTITLYFSRDAVGARDIWASTLGPDESLGPAVPVAELNTAFDDARPAIRRDGLEIFFDSNRPGSLSLLDIWVSTRASTSDPWSPPVNVIAVNSAALDARPALSFDGTTLYFHSGRPGASGPFDIYVATRSKLTGPD